MEIKSGENVFNIKDMCDKEDIIIELQGSDKPMGIKKMTFQWDGQPVSMITGICGNLFSEHYKYISQLRSDVMILNQKCEELTAAVKRLGGLAF